jgi:hypothetical protein
MIISLKKEEFFHMYHNEKHIKKKLVYSCYKDLFDEKERNAYIIKFIKHDTTLVVSDDVIRDIKNSKKEIICFYEPLWRTVVQPLQNGHEVDEETVVQPVKSGPEISINIQTLHNQIPGELPHNHVRVPHDFKQIRYHESLKSYIFDYPWHELDEDGIPIPARIGITEYERLQFLLDLDVYNEIKKSYVMPYTLKDLKIYRSYLFDTYKKIGFPRDAGGYHPDEKVFYD